MISPGIREEDSLKIVADSDISLCDIIELSKEIEDIRLEPRQSVKDAILNYAKK